MTRPFAAVLVIIPLARADQWSCLPNFRAGWAGSISGLRPDLRLVTEKQCDLPPAYDLSHCFSGRWVHVIGDSTARLPLQAFTAELLGCHGTADESISTLPDASAKDHERCRSVTTYGASFDGGPVRGLSTTFEPIKTVASMLDTFWFREQVPFIRGAVRYRIASCSRRAVAQVSSAAAQSQPDAVVIAAFLGDVVVPDTRRPVPDLIAAYLANFKRVRGAPRSLARPGARRAAPPPSRLRLLPHPQFLIALARSPRWSSYWAGRVYVRLVLPTERLEAWETLRGQNNPLAMPKASSSMPLPGTLQKLALHRGRQPTPHTPRRSTS